MQKPEYRKLASENMKRNQDKLKSGMISKYGQDNPSKIEEFRIKKRNIFLEKYGVENPFQIDVKSRIKKTIKTHLSNGNWIRDEDRKPFARYKKEVWRYTNQSIVDFDAYWLLEKRSRYENHIDHIYSIKDGFENNVPSELIGSIVNLQSLSSEQNCAKGSNSWISIEDLKSAYNVIFGGDSSLRKKKLLS